ncbi:MAG: DUF4271 domain-containing protein [Bacteroidales bacterium]|nr:DUF4271 domain-containing protein [Bacteroidales bacterium]
MVFVLSDILVVVSVLLCIMVLGRFMGLVPYLTDSYRRVRGSSALEGSIRVRQDRNLVALALLIPAILLVWRYRLYNPDLISEWEPDIRLCAVAAALAAFVLLRNLMYLLLRPRRGQEHFRHEHRVAYTYFIFLMIFVLFIVGILSLANLEDAVVRWVLYGASALVYLLFLHRCLQILSLSCNPLRTFLYLCGLEILPLSLLIVSGIVL